MGRSLALTAFMYHLQAERATAGVLQQRHTQHFI